ncbi:MAG: hypothetical protein HQL94_07615 [Magnetococcales bacterium]|nr:hypothetical protein [Magnetococcales bacterium]
MLTNVLFSRNKYAMEASTQPCDVAFLDTPQPASVEERPKPKTTLTKNSLAKENNQSRRTEQAVATLNRAKEIAANGLFKEAILLWEHATRLGTASTIPPATLLTWMINAQQYPKAVRFFTAHESILQYDHPQLWSIARELFAVVSLTGEPQTWQSPPWNQATSLRNALVAYSRGEDLTVRTQLVAIGPDSPFYSGRKILESLLELANQTEKITALLAGIPDTSPFAPLLALAHMRTLPKTAIITALLDLPPTSRIPASLLCGIDDKQLKSLLKISQTNLPCQQITLLFNHADALPHAQIRNASLNLLPDCIEERSRFEKRFGPLEAFERERLFALHHERQLSYVRAIAYWKKCILILENSTATPENRLKIALIYQHLASIEQKEQNPSIFRVIEHLENSLKLDPDNKKTWQELLSWKSRLKRDQQSYYQWADKASKRFPEDETFLSLAMATAMEKGSYKKASGIASRLQKLNPNRANMPETRLAAHLHHARKHILTKHFKLARKELARAAKLYLDPPQPLTLLTAMLEFLSGSPDAGSKRLDEGRNNDSQKVFYAVQAFHEAVALHIPTLILDRLRHDLIQCDATSPNREEVLAIADFSVNAFTKQPETTTECIILLSTYFYKAATLVYNQAEMRQLCLALNLSRRYTLLTLYGKIAENCWPNQPIFTFFRANGQTENQAWRLTDQDFYTLLLAEEDLKTNDPTGAALINALLAIPHPLAG